MIGRLFSVQTYNFYQLHPIPFKENWSISSPPQKRRIHLITLSMRKEKKKISLEDNTVDTVTPRSRVRQPRDSARQVVRDWGASGSHRVRDDLTPLEEPGRRGGREGGEGGGFGLGSGLGFGFKRRGDRSIPSRCPGCLGCGLAWKRWVGWCVEGRFCFRIGRRPFASLEEEVFRAGPLNLALASC